MTSWKELKQFHKNISVNFKFSRLPHIQHKYNIEKDNRYLLYEGTQNFLKFLFIDNKIYKITYAKYPYILKPNITHLILWLNPINFNNKPILYNNTKLIEKIIKELLPNIHKDKIIFFKNSPKNQSIKNILHYHIMILSE